MILLMMVDTPEEKRKFVILYENYRYLMLKVAVDILHDYQLAEDAVQEAFVRVAKHMENVGQPEETATKRYLITITKHAAYGNGKKHLIFQQTIVTNEKMIFDTNYNSVEQIRINGMTVFLYGYTHDTFWAYGEYGNSVYVLAGDTIPKEEIEKIYKHWIW